MKTHIYKTPKDVAEKVIERILDILNIEKEKTLSVALSGGSTPSVMFRIWAEKYSKNTDWNRIKFYWVDERCVSPTSKESNYGVANELLFSNIDIPKDNMIRIFGENEPKVEAIRYSEIVRNNVKNIDNQPCFDIVLLGAGDDGHTSSIFPGQEYLLTTEKIYDVSEHPINKIKRIALTGRPIICSDLVLFVITGESKSEVVKKMIEEEKSGPAAYIAHKAKNVEIYLDEESSKYI